MKYIKFNEQGERAYEAPTYKKIEDGTIFGYNNESNEAMLLADGWLKYTGNAPLSHLKLINGEIVEIIIPIPEPEPKTKFTKLQIRRCLREHGMEEQLDLIISEMPEFKRDWDDAQEIDLNDEMIHTAIVSGFISQELIDLIQHECEVTY